MEAIPPTRRFLTMLLFRDHHKKLPEFSRGRMILRLLHQCDDKRLVYREQISLLTMQQLNSSKEEGKLLLNSLCSVSRFRCMDGECRLNGYVLSIANQMLTTSHRYSAVIWREFTLYTPRDNQLNRPYLRSFLIWLPFGFNAFQKGSCPHVLL